MSEQCQRRLLWLTPRVPVPPLDGGRQRSLALLRAVADRAAVTVGVLHDSEGLGAAIERLPKVDWLDFGGARRQQLQSLPLLIRDLRPPAMRHFSQPAQRRAVAALLSGHSFAGVVVDTPYSSGVLPRETPPVVVNTHNIEREVWASASPTAAGGQLRLALDRWLVGAWEERVLRAASGVAVCSSREAAILRSRLGPSARLVVVPNGVDTEVVRPLSKPSGSREAVFVGRVSYAPNAEAVRYMCGEVAPLLAAAGLSIVVVGGEARDAGVADHVCGSSIRFAGRPAEVEPFYAEAFAAIIPLFGGSGTRLKALEAMASRRPVVSTAKGVEGLGLKPGRDYLRAETPAEFVAQLKRLETEEALWRTLADRGRALVEARFSWRTVSRNFLALLSDCGLGI